LPGALPVDSRREPTPEARERGRGGVKRLTLCGALLFYY
jgi:hypothetical protein